MGGWGTMGWGISKQMDGRGQSVGLVLLDVGGRWSSRGGGGAGRPLPLFVRGNDPAEESGDGR